MNKKLIKPNSKSTFGKLFTKFFDIEKINPITVTIIQPNRQTIYKTDDEMDEIVAMKTYEELVNNEDDNDEEESKDELLAKIRILEKVTNKKLNEILKLLKSD